ncbi:Predicted anti-sigma factor antagonist RsbV (Anti-anti-sigma-B factor) [Desulfamplus magnetovallimortis]|uniref:Predicted anti-sigma factor antagonist RsbV (Anti-anti-sigma-B factor) n=1 Tax=Desulfamplus magnetovallimortis TaxID=1246637 RepID=A0A1W1H916_9BACT|nr:STAS domain-containing protein [Desulfamplus magnetovallimortis]SLM28858.1 Predicted anti-sigma factor antagonist RsbV (Anti-anti-sigma-B factor) [Desulfamplus magnetovallimortis]
MSEVIKEGENTIIKPGTSVVASMAENFKQELLSAINTCEGKLIIDLIGVEMVDSVGLGVIIAAHNTLVQKGSTLEIINVSSDIYGLFSTMRLNRRFKVEKSA